MAKRVKPLLWPEKRLVFSIRPVSGETSGLRGVEPLVKFVDGIERIVDVACGPRPNVNAVIPRRQTTQRGSMSTRCCTSVVMNAGKNGLNDYRLTKPTFTHGEYPGV